MEGQASAAHISLDQFFEPQLASLRDRAERIEREPAALAAEWDRLLDSLPRGYLMSLLDDLRPPRCEWVVVVHVGFVEPARQPDQGLLSLLDDLSGRIDNWRFGYESRHPAATCLIGGILTATLTYWFGFHG